MLHIKRPRLIPVLDSLVVDQILARTTSDVTSWVAAIEHVRKVGRANHAELEAIREHLRAKGFADRTLVRILDALLWTSHRGSGLFASLTGWEQVFRPMAAGSGTHPGTARATKTCPQCAEDVEAAALMCRYYRYEFGPLPPPGPPGT